MLCVFYHWAILLDPTHCFHWSNLKFLHQTIVKDWFISQFSFKAYLSFNEMKTMHISIKNIRKQYCWSINNKKKFKRNVSDHFCYLCLGLFYLTKEEIQIDGNLWCDSSEASGGISKDLEGFYFYFYLKTMAFIPFNTYMIHSLSSYLLLWFW
jgi:hypothetical protein